MQATHDAAYDILKRWKLCHQPQVIRTTIHAGLFLTIQPYYIHAAILGIILAIDTTN